MTAGPSPADSLKSPSDAKASRAKLAYRPDIDGLRALAVIAVILFHLKYRFANGGFLGVDIFFVISGFLIGKQLIDRFAAHNFSYARFYDKRVRRIIPAILLLVVFTHIGAFLIFATSDYVDYSKSQIAQAGFVSNFYFMLTAGYFDQLDTFKPLLHTWTLSIEEQFYVVAPMLLALTRADRRLQFATILVCSLLSLFLYVTWNFDSRILGDVPFYNTLSRAWQIGAGTLLAFVNTTRGNGLALPPILVTALRLIAAAVLAACILFGHSGAPGIVLWTLLATAAACILVILKPAHRDIFVNPVAVFIGKISFGLYLWHWPAIVFSSMLFSGSPRIIQAITIGGSLAGACISYYLVEAPIRERRILTRSRDLFLVSFGGLALLTAVSAVAIAGRGWPERIPPRLSAAYAGVDDKNPRWSECFAPPHWETFSIERIRRDAPCLLGTRRAPSFALIGDSHANAIMPLFDALGKEKAISGAAMLYSGCPPLVGIEHVYEVGRECDRFNREAIRFVQRHHLKTVYLVGFWDHYLRAHIWNGVHTSLPATPILRPANAKAPATTAELDRLFDKALTETLLALRGTHVIIVGQPPQQNVSVPQALIQGELLRKPVTWFLVPRETALRRAVSRAIFARHLIPGRVDFVDTLDALCPGATCEVMREGRPLYYDDNHLSTFGAQQLKTRIAPGLR